MWLLLLSTACSSLACTTASALLSMTTTSSLGKLSNNNSLCHCIVRLIQKESSSLINLCPANDANSFASVLRPAFHLAANLTASPECRGIMWKVPNTHRTNTSIIPVSVFWSHTCNSLLFFFLILFEPR